MKKKHIDYDLMMHIEILGASFRKDPRIREISAILKAKDSRVEIPTHTPLLTLDQMIAEYVKGDPSSETRDRLDELYFYKLSREEECQIWVGSIYKRKPYFVLDGKQHVAYAVSWRLAGRKLIPGYYILHQCKKSFCCNPEHLYWKGHEIVMEDSFEPVQKTWEVTEVPDPIRAKKQNEYFDSFVDRYRRVNGCWLWKGPVYLSRISSRFNMPKFKLFDGSTMRADLYTYERAHGPIPSGYQLVHNCFTDNIENFLCVNPAHLEIRRIS